MCPKCSDVEDGEEVEAVATEIEASDEIFVRVQRKKARRRQIGGRTTR